MCYFVTVAVPAAQAQKLIGSVPRGLALTEVHNPSVNRALGPRYRTFLLTTGMCSCSLYWEQEELPRARDTQKRRRYEKLGWSAAKINRAIAAASAHRRPPSPTGLRADVRAWLADAASEVGELLMLAHWYDGDLEKERLTIAPGESVSPQRLREAELPAHVDQWLRVSTRMH